jgi:RNA polymerase sigma factor (sigma-70 family)
MYEESQQSPPANAECPPLEELACLVDGVLSPESAEATLGHILACPKCYEIYTGLLRFQLARSSAALGKTSGNVVSPPPPLPAVPWSGNTSPRWHRTNVALRLGPVAVLLERLVSRDGLTFDEACEALRTNHSVQASLEQLEASYVALPLRAARQRVSVEHLYYAPSQVPSPEKAAMAKENASRRAEILSSVQEAVKSLPADEVPLVRLHFVEGLTIAEIARIHNLDQKSLYRRRAKILDFLREYLQGRGLEKEEIEFLLTGGDGGGGDV